MLFETLGDDLDSLKNFPHSCERGDMCTFRGEMMSNEAQEVVGEKKPQRRRMWKFGICDSSLEEHYRAVFLNLISSHVDCILKEPIDQRRWVFTPYELETNGSDWAYFHVPMTCLMFQYRDQLSELLRLLTHPIQRHDRLTGLLILSSSNQTKEVKKGPVRWHRYGDWTGTEELLVFGLRDRRELKSGRLALLNEEDRTELIRLLRACLAGTLGP